MTRKIMAKELTSAQRFTYQGEKHVTIQRDGIDGFLSGRPKDVTPEGEVRAGEFRLLYADDVLAVALATGQLVAIRHQYLVSVEIEPTPEGTAL